MKNEKGIITALKLLKTGIENIVSNLEQTKQTFTEYMKANA